MTMTPHDWRARGAMLPWRGQQIFYLSDGKADGEPLLFLHGFPTSSWDWQELWPSLTAQYRCIALDYVGYGFSSKPTTPDAPYSIFSYADEAEAVCRALDVRAVHLLAHDLGDTVAQELLARDRERRAGNRRDALTIASVALLNGGIFPETHRPLVVQRLLQSPLGFIVSRLLNERRFRASFSSVFSRAHPPSEAALAGFWQLIERDGGARLYHRLIDYIRERRVHRDRWVYALLDGGVPHAMINGLLDPVSGAHVVTRLRELDARSHIFELPNVGHYPQIEAPLDVLAAYRAFRSSLLAE